MDLIEKKQNLAALVKTARGYLDAGDMDAYAKADADIDKLQAEITAEEKQQQREAALSAVPEAQAKPQPANAAPKTKPTATDEYKNAFYNAVRGGLNSVTGEERKILTDVMSTGSGSAGMLVMPEELETAVRQLLSQQVVMRRLATTLTLVADRKIVLASSYGAAAWIAENGAYPKVDDAYSTVTIGSQKLGKIVLVSEELLNDSEFDLQSLIATSFARAYAAAEETAYLLGTGSVANQPTGVLVDAQTGVTSAAATAITSDELLDLYYALKAGYRSNATFLMGNTTEKALRKLKNSVTGDYMWQPGLTAGSPNTLLGRPVENSDFMPAFAASAKAIAFGDFKQYTIKDTVGMQMQVLDQLYAENGQVGFKGNERTDGKLIIPEAVQVLVMHAAA